ncbi:hypothetical protein JXA80_03090 [bacterium]|nr:hypothetical protein [candidate division CSSED10-310 bacterium]
MRKPLFILTITAMLLVAGCGVPKTEDTVYDLILALPDGEREFDQCVVDLADAADHRYLVDGWHRPAYGEIPVTQFVWSAAEKASVLLDARTVEEKELLIAVRPYHFEGAPPNTLTVVFNDQEIGRITMKDEWRTYRLVIPEGLVRSGENRVMISQPRLFRPSDVMEFSADDRLLGASYAYFVFRQKRSPQPPQMYTLPQVLGARNFIWGGTQRHVIFDEAPASFSWTVTLPSHPILTFGAGYMPEGYMIDGADAEFCITIQGEDDAMRVLFRDRIPPPRRQLEMGWDEYRKDLSEYRGQTVRLTFETRSDFDKSKTPNSGSWLEPMIRNRHAACNFIFLPGSGSFPPVNPLAGSSFERLAMTASLRSSQFGAAASVDDDLPLPVSLMDELAAEGWPVGYFYTGRNPVSVEDRFGRRFDAVFGRQETTVEALEEVQSEVFEWIKRLEGRSFALIFDAVASGDDGKAPADGLEAMVGWLMDHRFNEDSLIIPYNVTGDGGVWISVPKGYPDVPERLSNWSEMVSWIRTAIIGAPQ